MAQSSTFTRLVTMGLTTLEDTSPLKTRQKFHKNGERGHIHANRFCYKLTDSYKSTVVELSFEEAASKRQCKDCFDHGVLDSTVELLLRKLVEVETSISTAERCIESKRGITDPGTAVIAIGEARNTLRNLKDEHRDLAETAIARYHERLDEVERQNAVRLGEAAGKLNAWAAGSLLKKIAGDGVMAIPGVDVVTARLFGHSTVVGRAKDHHIEDVYASWCSYRNRGAERAEECARETAVKAELHHPWQLGFPLRGDIRGGNLQEQAERVWREEVLLRLQETLIPAWETRYNELLGLEGLCVVGISGHSLDHDQSRTILSVNPTSESFVNGRIRVVALVPEVQACWLAKYENRWSVDVEIVKREIDADLLDAVLTLWQPLDSSSEFYKLEDAIEAATTL